MEKSKRKIGFVDSLRVVIAYISDNLRTTTRYPGISASKLYSGIADLTSNQSYERAMNETGLDHISEEKFGDILFQMGVPWGRAAMINTSPTGLTYMDDNQSREALKVLDRIDIPTRTKSYLKDIAQKLAEDT